MTDMTSREIHEAIDRAMKRVAAKFAKKPVTEDPVAEPEKELAEEPSPFVAPRD